MNRAERYALAAGAICLWGAALFGPLVGLETGSLWSATVAVLLLPGYLLDRRLGGSAGPLELPARALALSLGLLTLLAGIASLLGLGISALLAATALATAVLCYWPGGSRPEMGKGEGVVQALLLLGLAALMVALAWGSDAIARDRMWYMAYLTALGGGPTLDWSDPMLASGTTPWRFAHNGWLAALASVQALASTGPLELFEGAAPLLLAGVLVSASLTLARTVLGPGPRATAATFLTMTVLLSTKWPFFSPDRYQPFGRLAEDKTMALLLLAPVALAMFLSLVNGKERQTGRHIVFALVLLATASAHAMVYFIVLGTAVAFSALSILFADDRAATLRAHAWGLALVAAIALLPAYTGMRARSPLDAQTVMAKADTKHPAVRSHIRMGRHMALPVGGPIAHPRLLADPVLLAALGGLLLAWRKRRTVEGRYVIAASVPFLLLAFTPGLAPWFGRLVLPWMIYRALWALPLGLLILTLLLEGPPLLRRPDAGTRAPMIMAIVLLAAVAVPRVDWNLPGIDTGADRELLGEHGHALIAAVAELPETALVAAAPGIAELIPALAGRPVLAFSDRGTAFFAGSSEVAARRLEANAVVGGLGRGSRRLRNATIASFGVTHSVVARGPCRHRAVEVFESGGLRLCMEREHRRRRLKLRRTRAAAGAASGQAVVAALGGGAETRFLCSPAPERGEQGHFGWRRASRWSPAHLTVTCTARFREPVLAERLRIVANLPHAAESLVYRLETRTRDGSSLSRQGTIELRKNPRAELPVPGHWTTELGLRLAPSHLPYLNLVSLELLGPDERTGGQD